jgi:hypothetical protein
MELSGTQTHSREKRNTPEDHRQGQQMYKAKSGHTKQTFHTAS